MDGHESHPPAENGFRNASKSLAVRAPGEAAVPQPAVQIEAGGLSCYNFSGSLLWRQIVPIFLQFDIVSCL